MKTMTISYWSDTTVQYVGHHGDDAAIARAARVSVLGEGVADAYAPPGLIAYLMRHRHGSPFEHGSLTIRVHAPIFVFREWHRHRIGWSYNEESARYRKLDPVFWTPRATRPTREPESFTPARPRLEVDATTHAAAVAHLESTYREAWVAYEQMLARGVAREVARAALPVGIYSSMYATCNPRSIMHFLSLRTHRPDAAVVSYPLAEIDDAATQLEAIFARLWPATYAAWVANGRVSP
jgi:thymidylate synthase (FAD)